MKKIRNIAIVCLVLALCLSMAACGGGEAAGISKTYNLSRSTLLEGIGWYHNENYTLVLNDDNTYELHFITERFGAEDYDMRGLRTIIYVGTYTSAPSADEEPSHLDVTLSPATQISWDQQGKAFTRVQTLKGNFYINTNAWTDAMTTVYDAENGAKGAEEFLAEFGAGWTFTVEDPSLIPDDTTLTYRIVTTPDMGLILEEEVW